MRLVEATIESFHTISLKWDEPIPFTGVHLPDYTILNIHPKDDSFLEHIVEVNEELQCHEPIEVLWNDQSIIAKPTKITQTEAFDQKFYYDGPLGVEINEDLTTFRLWAPTAMRVNLQLYADEDGTSTVAKVFSMSRNEKGVWALSLTGDTTGLVYDYNLIFPDGAIHNSYDPYAKACIVNGRRSVVVTDDMLQLAEDWDDIDLEYRASEMLMMNIHVKAFTEDETSGISERSRGKYLGLIEPGTTNSLGQKTGLDYLQLFKPTHVRLKPIVDFGSVNERDAKAYSIGDDPLNMHIPEGSYASNPYDPLCRIHETKQMINGLHQQKLKVIVDMMCSRLTNAQNNALELCVPGYYLRMQNNRLTNELASERGMVRRYLTECIKYWLTEYHLDGICLLDINVLDIETVKEIRKIADEINANIVIMGEMTPLTITLPEEQQASMRNADQLFGVNFINNNLQHWLENYPNYGDNDEELLMQNMLGEFYRHQKINIISPDQIIQELTITNKPKEVVDYQKWIKFILDVYFLSQGAISIGINETLFKDKTILQVINWDEVYDNFDLQEYLRKINNFREEHPIFALSHYADITQKQYQIQTKDGLLAYSMNQKDQTFTVVVNTTLQKRELSLPTGYYNILLQEGEILDFGRKIDLREELLVEPLDVIVLCRK